MIQGFVHIGEKLRSSFWSLPLLMIILAVISAHILLLVDRHIDPTNMTGFAWLRLQDPNSARVLLSVIATSIITVAGTVFSITVVALTLASNQFGPSLVRNFIRDRGTQASLGIFLATFVYALVIIRSMDTLGEHRSSYDLSVQAAMLLALLSIGFLIYFIHNVAQSIQVDNITYHINREFHLAIAREFPHTQKTATEKKFDTRRLELGSDWEEIPTVRGGYVQLLDQNKLIELAREYNCCLQLTCHPGSFLNNWSSIGRIYQPPKNCDVLIAKIQSALQIGPLPTAKQDIVFSVRQLSQIAVRALSPGVNDPYTTYTCIDRLIEGLGTVLQRPQPPNCFSDENGHIRLITCTLEFSQLLDAALDEICEHARSNGVVMRRLLKALSQLADVCARDSDKKALYKYLQRLQEDCRIFLNSPIDRAAVERKAKAVQQKLLKGSPG